MRLGVSVYGLAVVFFLLFLLSSYASSRFYYFGETDSGWNTGIRESNTLTMDLSGFSMGQGSYSHYGEVGINDVRVRDRTSSPNGTLSYQEGMYVTSRTYEENSDEDNSDVKFAVVKPPGAQDYYITVDEYWPVHIDASRTLDFSGKSINDIEYFGNNFENAGSSFLYASNLRKDTSVNLDLKDVHFNAIVNDTSHRIVKDEFMPNLTLLYNHRSSFTGLATFRAQHSFNRKPAMKDEQSYWGTFTVTRNINSTSINLTKPWFDANLSGYDWLSGCCMNPIDLPVYSLHDIPLGEKK